MENNIMLHKLLTICSLAVFAATLTACNTMEGAGQDVENAGEAIEDSAD